MKTKFLTAFILLASQFMSAQTIASAAGGCEACNRGLKEAAALFDEGCYAEARQLFISLSNKNIATPIANEARAGAADCLYALGSYSDALDEYSLVDTDVLTPYQSALLSLRAGICAYEAGKYDEAKKFLSGAVGEDALRSDARFYLGVIEFDEGNFDAARAALSLVNTNSAPGNRAPYYLAQIDFAQGQWSKALGQARTILGRTGEANNAEMLRIAGESLYRLGKKADGLEYLRKYLSINDNPVASAQYLVGLSDYEDGNYSSALELLTPVTEKADGALRQSAYFYIGQIFLRRGDDSAALMAFDKAAGANDDPQVREAAYYNYAVALLHGGSVPFKSSAETLENFLKEYPDGPYSSRVAASLAQGYLAEKNYGQALELINRISEPTPPQLTVKQRALYSLAWQEIIANNTSKAEEYITQASAIKGTSRELTNEINLLEGRILADKGLNSKAIDSYRKYLNNAPASAANRKTAEYGLAYALYSSGKRAEAEKIFKQLSTESQGAVLADVYNRLGDLRYAADDFKTAADYYEKAFDANPANGDAAMFNRARMLGYQRDYTGKLSTLNSFCSRYPNSLLMPEALLETSQAQISLGRNNEAIVTYRKLIKDYPSTAACRKAYLQMAMTLLDAGHRDEAMEAYRDVISFYPTSDEAAQASALLKNMYMEDGRGTEYLAFVRSVENAPAIAPEDVEDIAHASAVALEAEAQELYDKDMLPEALEKWLEVEQTTTDEALLLKARLGQMRVCRDTGDNQAAIAKADQIIASDPDAAVHSEAVFTKACALDYEGNTQEAIDLWLTLTGNASDLYVAKSAYHAAEAMHGLNQHEKALKHAQAFVQSGSKQHYWVARGFILISDIYKAEGKEFEAKEYLEALRDNYPGDETDIITMIESRLYPSKE